MTLTTLGLLLPRLKSNALLWHIPSSSCSNPPLVSSSIGHGDTKGLEVVGQLGLDGGEAGHHRTRGGADDQDVIGASEELGNVALLELSLEEKIVFSAVDGLITPDVRDELA